jgi:hypothetical protein
MKINDKRQSNDFVRRKGKRDLEKICISLPISEFKKETNEILYQQMEI